MTPGPLVAGRPLTVAQTAGGLVAGGHAVHDTGTLADGRRILVTEGGIVTLAPAVGVRVMTMPVGQALRVPTERPDGPAPGAAPEATQPEQVAAGAAPEAAAPEPNMPTPGAIAGESREIPTATARALRSPPANGDGFS